MTDTQKPVACPHKSGSVCGKPGACYYPTCEEAAAPQAQPAQRMPLVQAAAPREIWLQISDEAGHGAEPFPTDHDGITWCQDPVLACEVRYVRADLAQAQPTLSVAKSIAAEQADDPSLWFVATTATEAHLQHALRHLAAAVEGTLVSSAKRLPLVQATAPREIWLQISDDERDNAETFPDGFDGITWSKDSATVCGVPYVRADLAQAQPAPAQEPRKDEFTLEQYEAEQRPARLSDAQKARIAGRAMYDASIGDFEATESEALADVSRHRGRTDRRTKGRSMTRDQIKAELRRSAVEDVFPFAYVDMDALRKAFEYRCIPEWIGDLSCDDCRLFFLLVAEALETGGEG